MSDEKRVQHLARIEDRVSHLVDLLNDILTLSKAQVIGIDLHPEFVNLETLCRNVVEDLQPAAHQNEIVVSLQVGSCPLFLADPKLLMKALQNLLSNAIKYSPRNSEVIFSASCSEGKVAFSVKDNGIGIPEDEQKHLFTLFHRASNVGEIAGTGLGLMIVKQAVEAHQGEITLESHPGVGSTFVLTIPLQN
jgi:signal transduction histidine kinase